MRQQHTCGLEKVQPTKRPSPMAPSLPSFRSRPRQARGCTTAEPTAASGPTRPLARDWRGVVGPRTSQHQDDMDGAIRQAKGRNHHHPIVGRIWYTFGLHLQKYYSPRTEEPVPKNSKNFNCAPDGALPVALPTAAD